MKVKFLCLILVMILGLSLGACASKDAKASKETTKATTEAPPREKIFRTTDGRFQITADESWKDAAKILNLEDATLDISRGADAHIVLISENKYNFSKGLSGYSDLVVRHMEKNIDNAKVSGSENTSLGDYNAYKTTITEDARDYTVVYVVYCAEIKDRYIQLVCWSNGSNQEKFAKEFEKIAKTLSSAKE